MFGRAVAACLLILAFPSVGASQDGSYTSGWLRDLPAGGNVFSLLESAQPEVTTDRFNSGGLNAGVRDRASAFLASWTQTRYTIDHVSISSPVDGTPMLFPELTWWGEIDVWPVRPELPTGATGLMIDFIPSGSRSRSGFVEGWGSGGVLARPSRSSNAPAVNQLGDFAHIATLLRGTALRNKLLLQLGAAFTRATTRERNGERQRDTTSLFVNTTYDFASARHLHALALIQQDARHIQSTYELVPRGGFYGAYSDRSRDATSLPAFYQADRLVDGPIPSLIQPRLVERRMIAGSQFRVLQNARQIIDGGVELERTSATIAPIASTTITERVDGLAARLWRFTSPAAESRRHAWMINTFATDHISIATHVTIDATLRFESADASADGAASGLSWRTLLPSAYVTWTPGTALQLEFVTGVSRSTDQPLLSLLAYGDPNAPTADVFRWDGENILPPPLVMRVGAGTGGDASFSTLDPKLKRPITDQFVVQFVAHPWESVRLRVAGVARRQSSLIGVVNTGVPISSYTMFTIPDANADWVNPADDQQLSVYNRTRESFGADRYLLTNPDVDDATMGAVVVSGEIAKPRFMFRIGGTASASVGSGGNRGYTAIENDQSMLGELFTNPNAATYARGRLFNDRAYTIKALSIVSLPFNMKAGMIARFQDGQPFSRIVVVPTLNQGAEAIQAFPRGRSRFSYRATLDLRLQKRIRQVDLIADAYNLLNASSEVEEYVVTGPRFREITAVQPPRAFHLGARVTF